MVVVSSEARAQQRVLAGKSKEAWEVPQDNSAVAAPAQGDTWLARLQRNLRRETLDKELERLTIRETEESKSEEEASVATPVAPARSRLEEDVRKRLATQSAGKLLKELSALLE